MLVIQDGSLSVSVVGESKNRTISKRRSHMSKSGNVFMVVGERGIKIEAEKHHEVEHVLAINENAYILSISPQ